MVLYCSKNYKIDIYGKSINKGFFKINYKRKKYDKVFNGDKIEFSIDLLSILENEGVALYTYNKEQKNIHL